MTESYLLPHQGRVDMVVRAWFVYRAVMKPDMWSIFIQHVLVVVVMSGRAEVPK